MLLRTCQLNYAIIGEKKKMAKCNENKPIRFGGLEGAVQTTHKWLVPIRHTLPHTPTLRIVVLSYYPIPHLPFMTSSRAFSLEKKNVHFSLPLSIYAHPCHSYPSFSSRERLKVNFPLLIYEQKTNASIRGLISRDLSGDDDDDAGTSQ